MQRLRSPRSLLVLGLTLALVLGATSLVLVVPRLAHAATTNISSCTEAALTSAITAASPGDTLHFTCNGTVAITSTVTISKNLTIDAIGHSVALDGSSTVRVLDVPFGVTFTLSHLTVSHGLNKGANGSTPGASGGNGFGGGLYNLGTTTILNCTFAANEALGGNGAAGAGAVGTTTPGGAGGAGGDAFGGAIENGGSLTITNSTFTMNLAQGGAGGAGGASGHDGPSGAGLQGGAGGPGGFALGGAIENEGTALTITGSTFAENTASGGTAGAGGAGGDAITSGQNGGAGGNAGGGGAALGGALFDLAPTSVTNSTFLEQPGSGGRWG